MGAATLSVQGNYQGGVERPLPVRLTTTSATAIVTATDRFTVIAGFSLANETASGATIDIHYNDGSTDFLVYRTTVPATDSVIVSDIPLHLYSGDVFKATAGTANAITVTPIVLRSYPSEVVTNPV